MFVVISGVSNAQKMFAGACCACAPGSLSVQSAAKGGFSSPLPGLEEFFPTAETESLGCLGLAGVGHRADGVLHVVGVSVGGR